MFFVQLFFQSRRQADRVVNVFFGFLKLTPSLLRQLPDTPRQDGVLSGFAKDKQGEFSYAVIKERKMRKMSLIFVLSVVSTCLYSTIINVPADQPTIQEGIDAAVNADTVLVQPGTYVENINYNGKNITVASLFLTIQDTTYISQTVIDGDSIDSVVTFESGEDPSTLLTGFTITNGSACYWGGGGI